MQYRASCQQLSAEPLSGCLAAAADHMLCNSALQQLLPPIKSARRMLLSQCSAMSPMTCMLQGSGSMVKRGAI